MTAPNFWNKLHLPTLNVMILQMPNNSAFQDCVNSGWLRLLVIFTKLFESKIAVKTDQNFSKVIISHNCSNTSTNLLTISQPCFDSSPYKMIWSLFLIRLSITMLMLCSQYGKRYFSGVLRRIYDSTNPKAKNSSFVLKQNLLLLISLWQFQGLKKMNSSTQRSPTGNFKVDGISLLSKMCQIACNSFLCLLTTSSSVLLSNASDSSTFCPHILMRLETAVRQLPSNIFLPCTKISQSWPNDLGQLSKILSVSTRYACQMSLVQLELQVNCTNSTIFP